MIMKQIVNQYGYRYVFMYSKPGKQSKVFVHRAVLSAWVRPPKVGEEGRHLNDNRNENSLYNLAWGTRLENVADKKKNGRQPIGESAGGHKVTEKMVMEIRHLYAKGKRSSDLAQQYGISKNAINEIVRGSTWSHIPLVPIIEKPTSARKTPLSEEHRKKYVAALKRHSDLIRKQRVEVFCMCGCGTKIVTPDSKGRDRKYVQGHNGKKKEGKHENSVV